MRLSDDEYLEKSIDLGKKGEMFVYNRLLQKYPKNKFLILDLHPFCEMDWVVIDKEKEEIIEIYEVKTTTTDKKEFNAGSLFQLRVFYLQQKKKSWGKEFIPSFLYVVRAKKDFWHTGNLEVLSEEVYPLDRIATIDFDKCMWTVK